MRKIKLQINTVLNLLVSKYFCKIFTDKMYIRIKYRLRLNKNLNLNEPKTFNEKLQWLKLNDRNPAYTIMVDKIAVKEYVAKKIGKEYLIPTLYVYDKFDDINFKELPSKFVMKCNHDSGGLVICSDKRNFNIKSARKKIIKSLKKNYYFSSREWPYKNVKPKIIIEKYMVDSKKGELIDYKFMCFNGKVRYTSVCSERDKGELKVDFYDLEWNKMPFSRKYQNSSVKCKKPSNYEKMIVLAEILVKNIPFARIDFYEVNRRIYFGEITFFPSSGMGKFNPEEWDDYLGEMLILPIEKKKKKNEEK